MDVAGGQNAQAQQMRQMGGIGLVVTVLESVVAFMATVLASLTL
jgi:hypothetical protein